jgi:hypothetical protein
MYKIPLLISSLTLLIGLAPAQAASSASASASISDLTLTLVDLDPLDGIAPSLTFNAYGYYDNYGYAAASEFDGTIYTYDSQSFGDLQVNPWQPGSVLASTGLASASASLTGPGSLGGSSMATAGQSMAPGGTSCVVSGPYQTCSVPSASFQGQVIAPYYYSSTSFTVSANTLVLIQATGAVASTAMEGGLANAFDGDGNPYTNYYGNNASASLSLNMSGPAASGSGAPRASGSGSSAGCGCWPAWGPASRRSGPGGAGRRGA